MSLQKNFPLIDYEWTNDGDFALRGGDIATTGFKEGQGFLQEVRDRLMSSTGDWIMYPQRGSDIDDYVGEMNTEDLRSAIEDAIVFTLTSDGFLEKQDFTVLAARASISQVVVRIDFDTSLTNTEADSTIQFNIVYDTDGKGPYIIR